MLLTVSWRWAQVATTLVALSVMMQQARCKPVPADPFCTAVLPSGSISTMARLPVIPTNMDVDGALYVPVKLHETGTILNTTWAGVSLCKPQKDVAIVDDDSPIICDFSNPTYLILRGWRIGLGHTEPARGHLQYPHCVSFLAFDQRSGNITFNNTTNTTEAHFTAMRQNATNRSDVQYYNLHLFIRCVAEPAAPLFPDPQAVSEYAAHTFSLHLASPLTCPQPPIEEKSQPGHIMTIVLAVGSCTLFVIIVTTWKRKSSLLQSYSRIRPSKNIGG